MKIGWDDTTRIITGVTEGKEIILKLDSKDAKVNGVDKTLDVPAKAINGRTLVPVRFIAESLDMNVVWNQESKAVKISKDDIIEWKYEGYEGTYPHKEYERKYVNGLKLEETRYNGKNHEFTPDTRIISKLNKNIKYSLGENMYLILDYEHSVKAKFILPNTIYKAKAKLTHVFYNLNDQKIRLDKNNTVNSYSGTPDSTDIYLATSTLFTRSDEIYVATIIEEVEFYDSIYSFSSSDIAKNTNYNTDIEYAKNDLIKDILKKNKEEEASMLEILKKELVANNNVPLKITDKKITYNSIGIPEAHISFKNVSNKTIDALELTIKCYDSYGRVVKESISNRGAFYAISQNRNIIPGSQQGGTWTLNLFRNTTKVEVFITSVHYTDGTVWTK